METESKKLLTINNHFERLPDDLGLNILNRIHDAKMLCNCTMVSKKFATMLYQIKSAVSLRLPEIDIHSFELYCNFFRVDLSVLYFDHDENLWPIHPPSIKKIVKIIAFLRNFRELESIDIVSACPKSPCTCPLLKWKAKLEIGNHGTFVRGLVSINAQTMCKLREDGSVQEDQILQSPPQHDPEDTTLLPHISCTEWFFVIRSLIRFFGSLRRVTCTDPHRHGAFVFEGEQIAEWRRSELMILDDKEERDHEVYGIAWNGSYDRDFRLPVAGYMLKTYSFMLLYNCDDNLPQPPSPENSSDDEDDDPEEFKQFIRMMTWDYGDDEKVLGEAVRKLIHDI